MYYSTQSFGLDTKFTAINNSIYNKIQDTWCPLDLLSGNLSKDQ